MTSPASRGATGEFRNTPKRHGAATRGPDVKIRSGPEPPHG